MKQNVDHSTATIAPNGVDYLAFAAALILGTALFLVGFKDPPMGDAASYLGLAQHFVEHGFLGAYPISDIRTYGYGAFLALPTMFGRVLSIDPRPPTFALQLGIYLSGAWLIRSEVARYSPPMARGVLVGLCVNVFVLIYVAETLTDGLTVALILQLVWITARLSRTPSIGLVLSGSLLVGILVMIRPGNFFLLPFWGLAVLIFSRHSRWHGVGLVLLAGIGFALPLLPQVIYNAQFHGAYTPLPTTDLRLMQHSLGIYALKYITFLTDESFPLVKYREPAMAFAQRAQVFYENPFQEGAPLVWPTLHWYLIHPSKGIATIGLHTFALLDQDIIFPYPRTLVPAYRWPVGVINHSMIGLALCGLTFAARTLRAQGVRVWIPCLLSLAYAGSFLAIYAFTVVEARFGLPLILFTSPLAAVGVLGLMKQRKGTVMVGLLLTLYVCGALILSEWIRNQAPTIRAAKVLARSVDSWAP